MDNRKKLYEIFMKYFRNPSYFSSILMSRQVIIDIFIGTIYLNNSEISYILNKDYYFRYSDRNYNYHVKLKTNKLKSNS